jgi:hypothetical protein
MSGAILRRLIPGRARTPLTDTFFTVALLAALVFGSVLLLFPPAAARADEITDSTGMASNQSSDSNQIDTLLNSQAPQNASVPDAEDDCLAKLPVPAPGKGLHRVIQLVCQALLGTANAPQQKGFGPLPVLPREGTWLMNKAGSANNSNVLTIDIPLQWENTKCPDGSKDCEGIVGPRFWARTGCRYDLDFDKGTCDALSEARLGRKWR